ncbi:MAG: preprotein translocase subunit Sec61beta, partial [Thermoplasmata archaeon]|nr:preprotein translocase subunit Sec61beta [Thermoplasmata archaeon]
MEESHALKLDPYIVLILGIGA